MAKDGATSKRSATKPRRGKRVVVVKPAAGVRDDDGRPILFAPSAAVLAAVLRVSESAIGKWIRSAGAPGKTARGYDLAAWVAWYFDHRDGERPTAGDGTGDPDPNPNPDDALKRAKAGREQLKLERERGESVPRTAADLRCQTIVQIFVAALEQLPLQLAPKIAGQVWALPKIRKLLTEFANKTRTQLADGDGKL